MSVKQMLIIVEMLRQLVVNAATYAGKCNYMDVL